MNQKVTEGGQYKYVYHIAKKISSSDAKPNPNPIKSVSEIDSFTFETDKLSGIHSIMLVANNNIVFK